MGRVMSSVSRPVSGQTPMRGMIEEQSVQSASVKGSVSSSESVIDASIMSSVSIVKEGSESSGMSELVDRMLKYQPPPNLTAEMGKTVDDVIKYMKSTAELLRVMALSTPASITHPIQTCLSDLDCLATVVYHCGMYRDGGVSERRPYVRTEGERGSRGMRSLAMRSRRRQAVARSPAQSSVEVPHST